MRNYWITICIAVEATNTVCEIMDFFNSFLLILVDAGFTSVIRNRSRIVYQSLLLLIIIYSIAFSYRLIRNDTIANYPDTGLFRTHQ